VKKKSVIYNLSLYCLVFTGLSLVSTTVASAAPVPSIRNQAEGKYQDPLHPEIPFTVYSLPVTISLQEVAGLGIIPTGITRQDSSLNGGVVGTPTKDTVLFYNFELQNIGSDTTQVFVPNLAQVGTIGTFQKVQYFDGTAWLDIPANGLTSTALAPQAKLLVRVVVKVKDAIGDLSVTIGKTAGTNTQNQLRVNNPEDIYTVDAPDGSVGEYDGLPTNGTREAQATQSLRVGFNPEALTTVKLMIDKPFDPDDRTITFGLNLSVADVLPPKITNISPTDLTGTTVSIDGKPRVGILVSDAIPLGTKFSAVVSPDKLWVPIYYYSSTPIGATDRADNVNWSTVAPDANTTINVRRVGFFRSDYRMPKGASFSGFQLTVEVTDFSRTEIYNIAQVFGTQPQDPNNAADATPSSQLIFEESGDNQPNNYNDDGTAAAKDLNQQPIFYPGILDPTVPSNDPRSIVRVGRDLGSADSPDGEFLVVPFKAAGIPSLKNGPREQPTAIGPNNNDDEDFTNKSTPISNGSSSFDPPEVSFTNTVKNTSDSARDIKVIPQVTTAGDLPDGTLVELRDSAAPALTASFVYQKGIFTPVAGSPATLVLTKVAAGGVKSYIVRINLPDGTPAVKGFPVKLLAFIDTNNNNIPDGKEATNATIDRTYTGFIEVVKESRVLDFNKDPMTGENGIFSQTVKPVRVDQYIEYRITYKNISTPALGTGNKTLSAINFTITEDGNAKPNNWGSLTANDPNSATSSAGKIIYSKPSGATDAKDPEVIKYENILTEPIEPDQGGTFTFRRRVLGS
jgi:hypothetical protein